MSLILFVSISKIYPQNLIKSLNSPFQEELFCGAEFNNKGVFVGNKEDTGGEKVMSIYEVSGVNIVQKGFYKFVDTSIYPSQILVSNNQLHIWGLGGVKDSTHKSFIFYTILDSTFKIVKHRVITIPKISFIETIKVVELPLLKYILLTVDTAQNNLNIGRSPKALLLQFTDTITKLKILATSNGLGYGRDLAATANGIKVFIHDGAISNTITLNPFFQILKTDSFVYLDDYLTSPILSFTNYLELDAYNYLLSGRSDSLMRTVNFQTTNRFSIIKFDSTNKPIKRIGFGNDLFEDGLENKDMTSVLAFNKNLIFNKKSNQYYLVGNWVNRYESWQFQNNLSVLYCLDSSLNLRWKKYIKIPEMATFLYSILSIEEDVYIIGNTSPVGSTNYKWDMLLLKVSENGEITSLEKWNTKNERLQIFPNPFHNYLIIENELNIIEEVLVYDNIGSIKYSNSDQKDNENIIINAELWQSGLYYVQIIDKKGVISLIKAIKR